MKIKRLISITLMLCILFSDSVFAAIDEEKNIIAQKIVQPISPGLVFSQSIELFDGVRQEIYSFKFSPGNDTKIVPAYGQYIYGFNSVGKLIGNYNGEGSVVGGINTDFFITDTGIPLSCLIEDNEIITSCDHRAAIGFTVDGNAVIGYPEITADFLSESRNIHVSHINKTPGIWGAYLVTDKFSKTTKTSFDSVEIVFRSYSKEETDKAIEEFESSIENASESDISTNENSGYSDSESFKNVEKNSANENSDEKEYGISDEYISETKDVSVESVSKAETTEGNVVYEEGNNENTKEDVIDDLISENLRKNDEACEKLSLYSFTDEPVRNNSEIDVVVTEIRDGVRNGEISEGTYVLCIPSEKFVSIAQGISIGDRFTLKVQSNSIFDECKSIFGAGSIIVENGEFAEQTNDSIFRYRNPRTAAGITSEGEVIFVCVDGRRPGASSGFTIKELSDYLISLGCVSAVNFDGGGSTTFYAQSLGEEGSVLKNTPSEGIERFVADGLLFVNTSASDENRTYAALYPNRFLTFNENFGLDISGKVKFADSNFHPIKLSDDESIILNVDSDYGSTFENVFVPSGKTGSAEIIATIPETDESYIVGFVDITDTVNKLNFKANEEFLTPFDDFAELSVNPLLNTIPVAFTSQNINWNIEYEAEDENGEIVWTEADETEAFMLVDEDAVYFVPFRRNTDFKIRATLGDYSEEISIFAEAHPFADMEFHWASETSYEMYKSKLLTGELSPDGTVTFAPSRYMTRAEFCAILSRALGLETTYSSTEDKVVSEENIANENITRNFVESESQLSGENVIDVSAATAETEAVGKTSDDFKTDETTDLSEINGNNKTDDELISEDIVISEDAAEETVEDEVINSEETEVIPKFSMQDVPEWAKGYVFALYEKGYLNELLSENSEGVLTVKANEYITRMDIIRVLGSIMQGELNSDILDKYTDFVPLYENDSLYFSRVAEGGIITGYEDGTVRTDGILTRAEGATVFSRFIKYYNY